MLTRFLVLTVAIFAVVGISKSEPPQGWYLAGSSPNDYLATSDSGISISGDTSAVLQSRSDTIQGFGTLMQATQSGRFNGKRVRFSAFVKTQGVSGRAGLWFRVDGTRSEVLGFDNMQDRPINGTTGWAPYSVVLDVSELADAIAFGVLLSGKGKVWIDNASFEVVDNSVPTTNIPDQQLPSVPINLDFEF